MSRGGISTTWKGQRVSMSPLIGRVHNLRTPLSAFIGRESQVAAVVDLLRRDDVRLVTLSGPGGVGKTRLATAAATSVTGDFEDGVWHVRPGAHLQPCPRHPRDSAGSRRARGRGRTARLPPRNLSGRATSLAGPGQLRAGRCRGALGGRFTRRLPGSQGPRYQSGPAARLRRTRVPGATAFAPCARNGIARREETITSEAVRLFVDRALAVKPDLALTAETAPAVAEICRRLDGLPLAIELAAARVKGPLAGGAASAVGAAATAADRRRARPAGATTDDASAIGWSHDLLAGDEQAVFRRLAVFVGGFTLEAAEAVVGLNIDEILEGIASLVDKSLLAPNGARF